MRINRDPIGENGGPNLYAMGFNNIVNNYDLLGQWTVTWVWNPKSHNGDSWASLEGYLPSGKREKNRLGIIIDYSTTTRGGKSRTGPATFTGTSLTIALGSIAFATQYVIDKGATSWMQWSGENQYDLTLTRAEGDSACADLKFTKTLTVSGPNGTVMGGGADGVIPRDVCVCCEDKNLGRVMLSNILRTASDASLFSSLAVNIQLTPVDSCP